MLWLFLGDRKPPSPGAFVGEAFPFYTSAAGEVLDFLYVLWSSIRGNIALSNCSRGVAQRGDPEEQCPGPPMPRALPGLGRQQHPEHQQLRARQGFCCSKFKKTPKKKEKREKAACLMSQDRRA